MYIYILYIYNIYIYIIHIYIYYTYIYIYYTYIYIYYTYIYIYIFFTYIYINIWYPPKKPMQTSILLIFTVIFFNILAPILFRLNLRHQQWENWKTEKLNSIGEVWGPFFSCGIQFFSFSVLGFSWKVKTRKAEKTEKIKWPQAVSIIILLQNAIFHLNL